MTRSDSIVKIAPALLKAQKTIGAAKKDAANLFFKSKYADLGAIMEACKDALNENGITVLQPVGTDEGGVYVETLLLHESGEYITDKMRIVVKEQNNPQAQGSAISYARRYSLQSMVFIPAEDDDGNRASQTAQKDRRQWNNDGAMNTGREFEHPVEEEGYCEAHEVQMTHVNKNGRDIWYHRNKEGEFCNGEGYKPAKPKAE